MESGRFASRTGRRELAALVSVSTRQRGRVVAWLLAGGLPAVLLVALVPLSLGRGAAIGTVLLVHGLAGGAAVLVGRWLERRARSRTVTRLHLTTGPLPWEVTWDHVGIEVRNLAGRSRVPWPRVTMVAVTEGTAVLLVSSALDGRVRGGFAFSLGDLPDGTLPAWRALAAGAEPV